MFHACSLGYQELDFIDLDRGCQRILEEVHVRNNILDEISQISYSGLASLIDRSWEDGLYRCYAAFSAGRPQRSGFVSEQFSNWIDRWSLPSKKKPSGSSPQDAESKESNRWSWLAVRTLLFLHPVKAVTKSNNGCPLWIMCINRTIGLMIDWHDWTTSRRNMTKSPAGGLLRRSTF